MKNKYKKGDVVRIKKTQELVKIERITPGPGGFYYDLLSLKHEIHKPLFGAYAETELQKIREK